MDEAGNCGRWKGKVMRFGVGKSLVSRTKKEGEVLPAKSLVKLGREERFLSSTQEAV